ncbi:hypothetical protein SAMN05216252_12113 [Actinacidiphila glaucinigra]|uniref:Uncharacterized protein n=1 Tax=Actinacidiphila glaucinigra TaxID=235986 RepID=A0A239LSX5_9ACTN|nr:hypothetical protein SAMN05216252_12113 [Actinacidiphila glaucinigra]
MLGNAALYRMVRVQDHGIRKMSLLKAEVKQEARVANEGV